MCWESGKTRIGRHADEEAAEQGIDLLPVHGFHAECLQCILSAAIYEWSQDHVPLGCQFPDPILRDLPLRLCLFDLAQNALEPVGPMGLSEVREVVLHGGQRVRRYVQFGLDGIPPGAPASESSKRGSASCMTAHLRAPSHPWVRAVCRLKLSPFICSGVLIRIMRV